MDSLELPNADSWDFLDYSFIQNPSTDFLWSNPSDFRSVNTEIDLRGSGFASVSADIDFPSGVDFASVSADFDIPSGVDFASASADIDISSGVDFASASADIDIPSGAVACQEENNTRKSCGRGCGCYCVCCDCSHCICCNINCGRCSSDAVVEATASTIWRLQLQGRADSCYKAGTKACREKLRREKLNERFCDLSAVLDPGRPVRTDKPAILDDAIRVLNQLKTEAEELKETNEKLLEEIKCLKAEKIELREEKLVLKADKEKMEKQLKTLPIPPAGFMPPPPMAAYQASVNKMAVYPNYGYMPMWQYLPQSVRDTSQDHELRPPAA